MYKKVQKCRMCGNTHLEKVLDLGQQALTGVFPRSPDMPLTVGPLVLVKCVGNAEVCGLLQLEHSYDLGEMYGDNYGYRSGLNASMVRHLHAKVARIRGIVPLDKGDLVIDIGSNDSTTLQAYPPGEFQLVGVDPTGVKFKSYYPPHIDLIPDFFSAKVVKERLDKKAKVVTSFSMFYDLEDPLLFMREIHEVLHDDGIWVFEQSYMPDMLATNSFDTVCHEHLEFYALKQIKWACDRVGFKILDVEFNDVNGGSFSITVAKQGSKLKANEGLVNDILTREAQAGLDTLRPYQEFSARVDKVKQALLDFISGVKRKGASIYALGASTKGNVLLQYCGLTAEHLPYVGEVNPDKYGSFTPGTLIPIISEKDLLAMKPDYLLVLPWHFRAFFEANPKFADVQLVFPLPELSAT